MPAFFHILETVPPGTRAHVLIDVASPEDEVAPETEADLTLRWVRRHSMQPGPSDPLLEGLKTLDLPPGRVQAYSAEGTSNVRAQRHHLLARGFSRDYLAPEGYWRNGRVGGHDHVVV